MKNFSIKNMNRPVILLFMLFLSGNIIILPLLIAGTGMDRKVILAMEQVKEEMKAKASDDFPADSDGDELTGTPLPDPAVIPPEEDVVPAGEAVREDFKLDSGAEKPVPASTPEPEKISLKEKLDQRGSLKFVDEDIRIVLRSLAKAYDFNVTLAPEVQGKVTVDFNNVKIINALNTILVDQGLGYRISGSILRVTSLEKIQEEDATDASREAAAAQKAVEAAKKRAAKEAAEPLVVQIFKLKYIDANDAKEAITPMISGRGKVMILQTKQYTGFEFEATEDFGAEEA
ncbi:MAG: hypothetical protein U9N73_00740, partial [Candidatus Auribacterota bacterium]|nr:hypothetical protein [Candidatus Auribacterota bacterium]